MFDGAEIGKDCIIGAGVFIEKNVILGSFCKVQRGVTLYQGVRTGDYCFFGPNATTTNDRNPRSFGDWSLSETIIETGASIGANATLIAGNKIGVLSLVAAGAVVTRDVQPGQIVAGNPAEAKGWVDISGNIIARNEASLPASFWKALDDPETAIKTYIELQTGGSHE